MISMGRAAAVFAILLSVWAFMLLHKDSPMPTVKPLSEVPETFSGWRLAAESTFSQRILDVLRPSDYLSRRYLDAEGNRVDLYIGYHGGGEDAGPIHSPKHCMPGSGWHEFSSQRQSVELSGRTLNLVRTVYGMGEVRQMLLYWFDVQGRSLNDEFSLKLWEMLGSIAKGRRDASFVRISVPFEGDEARAYDIGMRFVRDVVPILEGILPR